MVKACTTISHGVQRAAHTLAAALCVGWYALALPAHAASPLMIWPLDPVISGTQRAAALWVENRGSEVLALQARVLQWSQTEGEDQLSAQKEVVVSPPISQIPPGQKQLIRLLAQPGSASTEEQAYRILLDELPSPPTATSQPQIGVQIQLRYSIPLFVYAPTADAADTAVKASPALTWTMEQQEERHVLMVRNTGSGFARLTQVAWSDPDGRNDTLAAGLFGYVLAGSERRWTLDKPPSPGSVLHATVNGVSESVPRAGP